MSRPLAESASEYGRGVAGGLLFSLPLLYTMEVWWHGFIADPRKILLYLAVCFLLLLGYNRYAGLRRDRGWNEILIDCVEEMGIGVALSALILFLIGRIGPGTSFEEVVGKVAIEAGFVAIGVSVGIVQLGAERGGEQEQGEGGKEGTEEGKVVHGSGSDVVIGFCGAVLFAANIAATEEVVMIAVETAGWKLFLLALLSIVTAAVIVFFSDLLGSRRYHEVTTRVELAGNTAITYAVAVVASAAALWFFGRFDGQALGVIVREIVVLAFPAVIGASAGRLLLHAG